MKRDYAVHPDDCPHPDREVQETVDMTAGGLRVQRCQACGFSYHIIGTHERVVIEGDYLDMAQFRCDSCGLAAGDRHEFQTTRCD